MVHETIRPIENSTMKLYVSLAAVWLLTKMVYSDMSSSEPVCPATCFCDSASFLISCTGAEDGNNSADVIPQALMVPNKDVARVQRLDYRDLMIPKLMSDHVRYFLQLTELSVVQCHVTHLEDAVFVNNSLVERVDLSQNLLSTLNKVWHVYSYTFLQIKLPREENAKSPSFFRIRKRHELVIPSP